MSECLGIEAGTYIAFGNDANDILMLKGAKIAFCVGANESLKKLAHHLCDESSVAKMIMKLSIIYKTIH